MKLITIDANFLRSGFADLNNTTVLRLFGETKNEGLALSVDLSEFADNEKITLAPKLEINAFTAKELIEFNKPLEIKAVEGIKISINNGVIFTAVVLQNGQLSTVNLFDELLEVAGSARQADAFLRSACDNAQRYAHNVKRNIAAYNHFYGELTEDQKQWMLDNTVSYEHEMQVAKEAARVKNGGK